MTVKAFKLRVPDSWVEFDIQGHDLAAMRKSLVERHKAQHGPGAVPDIEPLFRQARRVLASARRRGAIYAAGTFEPYEDGVLMASTMVFGVTPPRGQAMSVELLGQQLGRSRSRRVEGTWRRVTAPKLPMAGPVARVSGVEDVPVTDDVKARMVTMHTVIPIPGEQNALVVSCSSPNLPVADPMLDLFGAITSTFSFS